MGSDNLQFDALVIASVGGVLGVAYLLGAMLTMLSSGETSVLVLADSIPFTTGVGISLALVAGLLSTGSGYGRYLGVVAFGLVAVGARPVLPSPDPLMVAQSGLALLIALYLVVRNPVPKTESSKLDENASASKVGSTIR